jgi:hypothetical protein
LLLFCWIYYVYLWFGPILLLQCLWCAGLVFRLNCRVLLCSFCNSWVFCLRILLSFHIYLFCLWALKFYIPLVPVCWSSFQLYYLVDLRDFLFTTFLFDFLYLILSVSSLYSSFISCIIFFISYTSIFIVSLVSFWSFLKSSLSSFSCFCVFLRFFYPCSLDICWTVFACFL